MTIQEPFRSGESGHQYRSDGMQTTTGQAALVKVSVSDPLETDDEDEHDVDRSTVSGIGHRSAQPQGSTSPSEEYKYENGRRYHSYKEGSYHLPNDDIEQERLDWQHRIFRIALDGRLFLAPLAKEQIHAVLDVGCGTGKWCTDVADKLPDTQVLGFDLSPIQPALMPRNCKFIVEDCNSDWSFAHQFDLVHTRAMTPSIRNWPRFIQQVYDNLKPGGYIELHEIHVPIRCTETIDEPRSDFEKWSYGLAEGGEKVGLEFQAALRLEELLLEQGFENINIQWQRWPVGTWAKGSKNKEIGQLWADDLQHIVKNTAAMFTRVLGWTSEDYEVFAVNIAEDIRHQRRHWWSDMCMAYAQKPLDE